MDSSYGPAVHEEECSGSDCGKAASLDLLYVEACGFLIWSREAL